MNRIVLPFVALLVGCAPDAREIAINDVNLRDMDAVANIRAQLKPQEQVAFANFLIRHHADSAHFCGKPLTGPGGKPPATIGEAVDYAMLRDEADRLAAIEAKKPKHQRQLAKEEWDRLIASRDILVDSQSRLRMEFGDNAERRSEWKSVATRLAAIDKQLVEMKPAVFGMASY